MRRSEGYVTGKRGRYQINPPIVHPPHCICRVCLVHRKPDEWGAPFVWRIRRQSMFPLSRPQSAAYALEVKRIEEEQLIAAMDAARARNEAIANAVSFSTCCDAYRKHLRESGKRIDRAASRIDALEGFFGRKDAALIGWAEYQEVLAEVALLAPQTRRHYASTLTVILNYAVEHRLIVSSALGKVPKPRVTSSGRPVTWTKAEVAVLLGPAMTQFERLQSLQLAKPVSRKGYSRDRRLDSRVPLRGLCLVAYFTLMRPNNNRAWTWEEIDSAASRFELDQHKNVNRGIRARGPIAAQLAKYLRAIRPDNARGPVHGNPRTGLPYRDIRKQWNKLVAIASDILGYPLIGRRADFFTWRHTGASHLAEKTKNPVLIVQMMGDTNIKTVMKHYFDLDFEFMAEMVADWTVPTIEQHDEALEDVSN
jgi:integrase